MRRVQIGLAIVLVAAVVFVGAPAGGTTSRVAPDFSLTLFTGKVLSLSTLRGAAVILLFWAPW
ncbi:MAG TPA: hypothetical protein VEP50_10950 [bacterium]|nr:hypothetical protein [bacterium]